MLIAGTEQGVISIFDTSGMIVKKQIQLKSVPAFIECSG